MKTYIFALTLANFCYLLQGQNIRIEPFYKPFWAKEKAPFSINCVSEHTKKVDLEWVMAGGDPGHMGFQVRTATVKTLGDGKVRTSLGLYKPDVTFSDIDAFAQVMCKTKDGKEDTTISIEIMSVVARNSNISMGADVSVECRPDGDWEGINITWYRNGARIIDDDKYDLQEKNCTLVVRDSRPEDAGAYTCNISFPSAPAPGQTILQEIYLSGKPYMTQNVPTGVDILLNQTLSITCPVAGYPSPTVNWLRGGDTDLKADGRITFASHGKVMAATLVITNLTASDLGEYACEAENDMGRVVKEFQVGLVGAAVSERSPGVLSVLAGTLVAILTALRSDL